jgi:hypothetical protein
MAERYPVYAEADIVVDSADGPPEVTVERMHAAVESYLAGPAGAGAGAAVPDARLPNAHPEGDAGR